MVTRYRNLLLLYLLYVDFMTLSTVTSFFFRTESVLKRRHQTAGGHMPSPPCLAAPLGTKLPTVLSKKNNSQLQKLEGTEYTWSPLSPKLEGTRPTGPVGWLRLCLHPSNIYIYMERVQTPIQKLHHR